MNKRRSNRLLLFAAVVAVLFAIGSFSLAIWRAAEVASPLFRYTGFVLALAYIVWVAIEWRLRRSPSQPIAPDPVPGKAKGHLRRVK